MQNGRRAWSASPTSAATHRCQRQHVDKVAGLGCHRKSGTVEIVQQLGTFRDGRQSGAPAQFVFDPPVAVRRAVSADAGSSALAQREPLRPTARNTL